MNMLSILSVLAAVLIVGLLVTVVVLRQLAAQSRSNHDRSIAAAVQAAMAERGATAAVLERDREATVQAAVVRAAEVAEAKLDARMREGTEQLDARLRQSTERIAAGNEAFEKQAADINAELRRMQKLVSDLRERSAGQHGAVVKGLENAAKVTSELQRTAGGLREALASPKARGQWGERMAEDVLRAGGFVEGINYQKQKAIESGGIPDISFAMPKDMVLHMDVKFPMDNYLRYLEATEAADPTADDFRVQFRRDAKAKVTELAARRYDESARSVDYVLLFMPNDSVFAFVQENDPTLIDVAIESRVVLCGPSTLFAVLAVVRQAMDNFMLERRGAEILDCMAQFRAEWSKFSGHVDKLGKQLGTVQNTYEQLSATRTNQMERKLRRIDELQNEKSIDESRPARADGELDLAGQDVVEDWPPPALRTVAG